MSDKKCEVCGNTISGSQCPECGWILVHLPDKAPRELKTLLDTRTSKMKEAYRQQQLLQQMGPKMVGVVFMENTDSSLRPQAVLPVYDGENTYGSAPSDGNHHKITLNVRGVTYSPRHFKVTSGDDRLVVSACDGELTCSGRIADKVYADGTKEFHIGKQVLIKVLKF